MASFGSLEDGPKVLIRGDSGLTVLFSSGGEGELFFVSKVNSSWSRRLGDLAGPRPGQIR
jgi:hypothetical protein